jgi:hypothetical protein
MLWVQLLTGAETRIVDSVITRYEAALRLGITLQMASRHGLGSKLTEAEVAELDSNPPPWLAQSRANKSATARPVWVDLTCDVCGHTEAARPKKWWPVFTYLSCNYHDIGDVPEPEAGLYREEIDGIGTQFVGIVDKKP